MRGVIEKRRGKLSVRVHSLVVAERWGALFEGAMFSFEWENSPTPGELQDHVLFQIAGSHVERMAKQLEEGLGRRHGRGRG